MQKFETSNRKLEQFFFAHDIFFDRWYRGLDGFTVWVYTLDDEGRRVLEEYRTIILKRHTKRMKEKGD